jgi:F0F1-type ATP synthase gamma subunit
MLNKKSLLQEVALVDSIKTISEAYQEISVMKMQKIRHSVLYTRQYLAELSDLFYDVKEAYKLELSLEKKKHHRVIEKNGKSVAILLSANTKLYGDIINRVSENFLKYITDSQDDIIIVGKLGRELVENQLPGRKYLYFEIPDVDIKLQDLKALATALINYEKVTAFYGQFESVVTQNPVAVNISGDNPLKSDKQREVKKFIFEPLLTEVMKFFESQIVSSLVKQSVNESQLSRHASRILAMEMALTNIESKQKILKGDQKRLKRIVDNKKQLESFSGSQMWK